MRSLSGWQRLSSMMGSVLFGVAACSCSDDGGSENGGNAQQCDASANRQVAGLHDCEKKVEGHYYFAGLIPYEGPWPVGDAAERALRQAVKEMNDGGGINGKCVGLVLCNCKGDGTTATARMRELVQASPVSATVGGMLSAVTIAASQVAIAQGMAMVAPSSTSPAITELQDNGWISRTVYSDAFQGRVASAIAKREQFSKVFVIHVDDPYGNGMKDVFMADFPDGTRAADSASYDASVSGYAATAVAAAQSYAPDAVFVVGFFEDSAAIVGEAISQSWTAPKWIFADGARGQDFVGLVGNNAFIEGSFGTGPMPPSGPAFEYFSETYQKLYNKEPEAFMPNVYDAAYLIGVSMALSNDPDNRTQVRDHLLQNTHRGVVVGPGGWTQVLAQVAAGEMNYEGASGSVDLDANGDVLALFEEWSVESGVVVTKGCWTPDMEACP